MTNEVKYNGFTVKTMHTVIPCDETVVKGYMIYVEFDDEQRKYTLDVDGEHRGMWFMDHNLMMIGDFQTIENFLKGIDNMMNLGNEHHQKRMKEMLRLVSCDCYENKIEHTDVAYETFLSMICELGVFQTELAQYGWPVKHFTAFFNMWKRTYGHNKYYDKVATL